MVADQRSVEEGSTGVLRELQRVDLQVVPNHVVVLVDGFMDQSSQKLVPVLIWIAVSQFSDDAFCYVLHRLASSFRNQRTWTAPLQKLE